MTVWPPSPLALCTHGAERSHRKKQSYLEPVVSHSAVVEEGAGDGELLDDDLSGREGAHEGLLEWTSGKWSGRIEENSTEVYSPRP